MFGIFKRKNKNKDIDPVKEKQKLVNDSIKNSKKEKKKKKKKQPKKQKIQKPLRKRKKSFPRKKIKRTKRSKNLPTSSNARWPSSIITESVPKRKKQVCM